MYEPDTVAAIIAAAVIFIILLVVVCIKLAFVAFDQKFALVRMREHLQAATNDLATYHDEIDTLYAKLEDARLNMDIAVNREVAKSIGAQRSTIKGQLAEQFYPVLGDCPYAPSDMRFMGDFCDYIVVDGYTDVKDGSGEDIKQIVFVEIKTGKSRLSKHQAKIRDAVLEGRVSWDTVRL